MNQSPEKVLSYLTGSEKLDTVLVDDLQQLVAENPYFPVSRLLLTKKLKDEKEQYLLEVQKTALYFPNPYWLQLQLTNGDREDMAISDNIDVNILTKEDVVSTAGVSSVALTPPRLIPFSTDALSVKSELADETLAGFKEASVTTNDPQSGAELPEHTNYQIVEEKGLRDRSQAEEEAATISHGSDNESNQLLKQLDSKAEPDTHIHSIHQERSPADAEAEIVEYKEEMAGVSKETDTTTSYFLKELAPANTDLLPDQDDEHDKMFQNIKAMLDASVEEADADTRHAAIPMDPYYTIDYFASQGIKLELEQNPQDQLGQHLKKFTHWLRHMKKLGPEDATEAISKTASDADIQQIADSSNTVREVVTEAMALVLEKQGKKEKAIELYNKLSFLNPDKNAYFADKIKKLKGS